MGVNKKNMDEKKSKHLLELYQKFSQGNIEDLKSDFYNLTTILFQFIDHLHDAKVQLLPYRRYLEVNLMKIGLNCSSLINLYNGTALFNPSTKKDVNYHDISSIFILIRSQIESYLTFFYLNTQSANIDQSNFRVNLYDLSGLNRRQNFPANSPAIIAKKQSEKQEMDKLEKAIIENSYFTNLPPKRQKHLLKRKPAREVDSWVELIDQSPLSGDQMFKTIWSLYSNFAHSEMLGMMQLKGYLRNKKEQEITVATTIKVASIVLAKTLVHLIDIFSSIKEFKEKLPPKDQNAIDFWNEIQL